MTTATATTAQVYEVFIRATPEAIWEAITKPEFTVRHHHGVHMERREGRRFSRTGDGRA